MLWHLVLLFALCLARGAVSRSYGITPHVRMTNAERLARGLPPARPKRLFGSGTTCKHTGLVSARRIQLSDACSCTSFVGLCHSRSDVRVFLSQMSTYTSNAIPQGHGNGFNDCKGNDILPRLFGNASHIGSTGGYVFVCRPDIRRHTCTTPAVGCQCPFLSHSSSAEMLMRLQNNPTSTYVGFVTGDAGTLADGSTEYVSLVARAERVCLTRP